jgi:hypothetical protein
MTGRPFWIDLIYECWKLRSIVWLSGVRRVGKTTIAKMIPDAIYHNCDLPSVARKLEDPEFYFQQLPEERILIFDEIHKLSDPSNLLKIAADEFPKIKVLATGSSTLEATKKFKDSLTGRKNVIHLPPVLWDEARNVFKLNDLDKRLFSGGLPEPLVSDKHNDSFYSEWIDSFYARDIQELFNVRNRSGFLKLMQLLLRSSGNLIDFTNLSKMSGLTRPTVTSYLEAMRISNIAFFLPPFHGGGRREITHRPKSYCFDTGFVRFINGWNEIREGDRGLLWEHLVLDMLRTRFLDHQLFYWRDKSGREIDFVIKRPGEEADIIECKINPDSFNPGNMRIFRTLYPNGKNYCYCPFIVNPYLLQKDGMTVEYIGSLP